MRWNAFEEEPDTIVQPLVEEKLPVACPMFQFGVKEAVTGAHRTEKDLAVIAEALLDIMASDSSPMFRKLLDAGLVNEALPSATNILRARATVRCCSAANPATRRPCVMPSARKWHV